MSLSPENVRRSARNAFVFLAIGVFFLLLALPANRDMERLLIGVGAISIVVALVIVGFVAPHLRRRPPPPAE